LAHLAALPVDNAQLFARIETSEERFRATFEQAAVGIAHVSPEGNWIGVNQRLCDITGYSREELLTKSFQDITYPGDLQNDLIGSGQLLAGTIDTYSTEKRYIRKDGSPVWIDLKVSRIRDQLGNPGYFVTVVQDIQARKQALQARDEVLTLVLHNLRSPLGAIAMGASFLLDVPLPEEQNSPPLNYSTCGWPDGPSHSESSRYNNY
jgi:PAS domain S-box-containing protein